MNSTHDDIYRNLCTILLLVKKDRARNNETEDKKIKDPDSRHFFPSRRDANMPTLRSHHAWKYHGDPISR